MAENINLKPITDVPAVEELPDGATVLINDNGAAKQIPANKIVAEPVEQTEYMQVKINVDTDTPTCDKTFDEIKAASDNGKVIIFYVFEGGLEMRRTNIYNVEFGGSTDAIIAMFMNFPFILINSDGTIQIQN